MIEAVIFDFDGLILETEMPQYQTWRRAFEAYGLELPITEWIEILGRNSNYADFPGRIAEQSGQAVDRDALTTRIRTESLEIIEAQPVLPGVVDRIEEADRMGFMLAVCSGSSRAWIASHLGRLGLLRRLPTRVCSEDTIQHKPLPDPYLKTAETLDVEPSRCLVFEDSPNGIAAAKAAGMFAVAVPTAMTADQDFSNADIVLSSLSDMTIAQMLDRFSVAAEE